MGSGGLKDEFSDGCGLTAMVLNFENARSAGDPDLVVSIHMLPKSLGRSIWPC
jgi:hypothetical protein